MLLVMVMVMVKRSALVRSHQSTSRVQLRPRPCLPRIHTLGRASRVVVGHTRPPTSPRKRFLQRNGQCPLRRVSDGRCGIMSHRWLWGMRMGGGGTSVCLLSPRCPFSLSLGRAPGPGPPPCSSLISPSPLCPVVACARSSVVTCPTCSCIRHVYTILIYLVSSLGTGATTARAGPP